MKKVFIAMGAIAAMACSCTKEEMKNGNVVPGLETQVSISLTDDVLTRASGSGHGEQADDNNIKTLEIFIFRINEGGPDDGMIDGYRKFDANDLKTLSSLTVKTTTGKKMIYVIANSHKTDWTGISRSSFEQQMAYLYNEDVRDFIMFAGRELTVQLESTISMVLTRMVSRVRLNSVKVSFAGSVFEGVPLENVKAYLTNVQAQKLLVDGSGDNLKVVNSKKYVPEDMEGCTMEGMLYDELTSSINESTYSTPHYFYCYENNRTQESETDRFTRLVIEGSINGITYYYPIPIKELKRNSSYTIDVRIYRPGSLDPDKDLEIGTLDARLNIQGWNTLPSSIVEF